jgi:hypothetical protein
MFQDAKCFDWTTLGLNVVNLGFLIVSIKMGWL